MNKVTVIFTDAAHNFVSACPADANTAEIAQRFIGVQYKNEKGQSAICTQVVVETPEYVMHYDIVPVQLTTLNKPLMIDSVDQVPVIIDVFNVLGLVVDFTFGIQETIGVKVVLPISQKML